VHSIAPTSDDNTSARIGAGRISGHHFRQPFVGNYHWARTSNPFTLKLGDNVSSAWDSYSARRRPTGTYLPCWTPRSWRAEPLQKGVGLPAAA
jgi:hypothetical protein